MSVERRNTMDEPIIRGWVLRALGVAETQRANHPPRASARRSGPAGLLERWLASRGRDASAASAPDLRSDIQEQPFDIVAYRPQHERRVGPLASGLLGAAVGAGLAAAVGALDRRGRKELLDQGRHVSLTLPRAMRTVRRDARNRTQGLIASVRQITDRGPVDDEVLKASVQSALGRGIRHARGIDVSVTDGVVTVGGRILEADHEAALDRVRGVRGVRGVRDELTLKQDPVALSVGPIHPAERSRPDLFQEQWSPTTRLVAMTAGTAAIGAGIARRDLAGAAVALAGAAVALRALSNMTFGRLIGVSGGRRGIDVHKTITVQASPADVYTLWSRFEEFPRFMSHVVEVHRLEGRRSHWRIHGPVGLPVEFDAEQTLDEPEQAIGWKSMEGEPVRHAGIVRFEPVRGGTRIDVQLSYNPPAGLAGHAAARLAGADPESALDDDMLRLKSLLEEGKTTAHGEEVTGDSLGWDRG